jgi:hypothetical protein
MVDHRGRFSSSREIGQGLIDLDCLRRKLIPNCFSRGERESKRVNSDDRLTFNLEQTPKKQDEGHHVMCRGDSM